jgi:hypothetical protein
MLRTGPTFDDQEVSEASKLFIRRDTRGRFVLAGRGDSAERMIFVRCPPTPAAQHGGA